MLIPINVFFSVVKVVDPTIKIMTFAHKTIDSSYKFPLENCTFVFKGKFKYSKSSRVYIKHKIKSAIPLSVIKYVNSNQLCNIFMTLINHSVYLLHKKIKSHKEHVIRFFRNMNPKVTL